MSKRILVILISLLILFSITLLKSSADENILLELSVEEGEIMMYFIDSSNEWISTPSSIKFTTSNISFEPIDAEGILGTSGQKLRVDNASSQEVELTAALEVGNFEEDAKWIDGEKEFLAYSNDGISGGLEIDASNAILTDIGCGGVTNDRMANRFVFGPEITNIESIDILNTTGGTACNFDLTNVKLTQTIPPRTLPGNYSLGLVLTLTGGLWYEEGFYVFGRNNYKQLGLGDEVDRKFPIEMGHFYPEDIEMIGESTGEHTLILLKNGDVYSFGRNTYGQLGLGDYENRSIPTKIDSLGSVKHVASDYTHSLVLLENGDVYSFGRNNKGQLGLGDYDNRDIPTKIETLSNVKSIYAESYASFVILENGDVYSWGADDYGQLGLGGDEPYGGDDINIPTKIDSISGAKALAIDSCTATSYILLENGNLYSIGGNGDGNLGIELMPNWSTGRSTPQHVSSLENVKSIHAGICSAFAILESEEVYGWGANWYDEFALGPDGHDDFLGINRKTRFGAPIKINYLSHHNIEKLIVGYSNVFVLFSNGKLYGTGNYSYGQLGVGEITTLETPYVQIDTFRNVRDIFLNNQSTFVIGSLSIDFSYILPALTGTNSPIATDETLEVNIQLKNDGSLDTEDTITLEIGGQERDSETIFIEKGTTKDITLSWVTTEEDRGTHTIYVHTKDETISTSVQIKEALEYLSIGTNSPVEEEETIEIDVYFINNTASRTFSQTLTLEINDSLVDSAQLEIGPGESNTTHLSWQTSTGDEGEHLARVYLEGEFLEGIYIVVGDEEVIKNVPWTQEASFAGITSERRLHTTLSHDNKLWRIGGARGQSTIYLYRDVQYTTDGTSWTTQPVASWTFRGGHTSVVFDNKMWVIGGWSSEGLKNDVWYSEDGASWTQATDSAGWSPRRFHTSLVFDNKMWVIGGNTSSNLTLRDNEVWYSEDGINWTKATDSSELPIVSEHSSVVFDNKMWVIGGRGNYTGIWYSEDGISWTLATNSPEWSSRNHHASVVFQDRIWVFGGYPRNDQAWYSIDGVSWTHSLPLNSVWTERNSLSATVFNNKMWVSGGQISTWNDTNTVWSSDGLPE